MADTSGVLSRLQAALSTFDPSWDVSVGSATYKILESVAQEIANSNNNSTLQTYSYDINTKSGSDLDTFCNLFGVYRQLGKRAVGTVTFYCNTATANIVNIPLGTQVAVPVGGNYTAPVYFATTAPAIIPIGATQVNVPVIASLPGIYGNVYANTVTALVSTLNGVTSVSNLNNMTGGTDPESDAQLRSRWQNSAFNNTTGTNGKYILTALQNPNVSIANAIGLQQFYTEQLPVQATISGGTTNYVTFQMIAYSGMTNVISGTTYSGTNVVTFSGFPASTTGTTLAAGLQAMISGVAPQSYITVTATPTGNTISGGLNITLGAPSPYRLTIGSGSAINGAGVTSNGAVTISGTTYTEYMRSLNQDIGASGTPTYNGTYSGFVFPQGNELVGSNINTASQTVYTPNSDYFYNSGGTITVTGTFSPQIYLQIANPSFYPSLFIGNTVQLISEYNPASSRAATITSGNYVDIFINGTTAAVATEQSAFNTAFTLSSGNTSNRFQNTLNYVLGSGSVAASNTNTSGDYYVPFDRQPMINFPAQVSTASSGVADTVFLYNAVSNSGYTYPIALNKYGYISVTGTVSPTSFMYSYSAPIVTGGTVSGGYSSPYIVFSGTSAFISGNAFPGTVVVVTGASNNSYNGTFTVVSATNTTFSVQVSANPGTLTGNATASLDNSNGVTLSGSTISGVNFVAINNASSFLYPGLALSNSNTATGILSPGQNYWIQSVSTSGVYLNANVNNSGTLTTSGKALVYPLYDITNTSANSVLSMNGLAFDATTPPSGWPTLPASGSSWVQYTHNFNNDVVDVESLIQQSRPIGVNTLTHQASYQPLSIALRIVLAPGYSLTTVQSNITNQLNQYFSGFNFLAILSFASLQSQILGVSGVANAKVTGVSIVALDGTTISTYTNDFVLGSNQLPVLSNIKYTVVGTSTF